MLLPFVVEPRLVGKGITRNRSCRVQRNLPIYNTIYHAGDIALLNEQRGSPPLNYGVNTSHPAAQARLLDLYPSPISDDDLSTGLFHQLGESTLLVGHRLHQVRLCNQRQRGQGYCLMLSWRGYFVRTSLPICVPTCLLCAVTDGWPRWLC